MQGIHIHSMLQRVLKQEGAWLLALFQCSYGKPIKLFLLLLSGLVTAVPAFAQKPTPVRIKEVTIAVGISVPPYVDRETQSGIELQIIHEALAEEGYRMQLKFLAGNGSANNFVAKRVDAMLVNRYTPISEDAVPTGFPSENIIHYHNFAFSLKASNYKVQDIDGLSNFRVIGFYNAAKMLGPEFAVAVQRSPLYREVAVQTDQVIALYRGMVDVAIADSRIFTHFQDKLRRTSGEFHEVTMFDVFPPSPRHLIFQHKQVRDSFDRGLTKLKASGRYQAILTTNTASFTRFHYQGEP